METNETVCAYTGSCMRKKYSKIKEVCSRLKPAPVKSMPRAGGSDVASELPRGFRVEETLPTWSAAWDEAQGRDQCVVVPLLY